MRHPPGNSKPSAAASIVTATDVVEIVALFVQNDIDVFVDGGWAVDALLGRQTRQHADLDIAIQHKDVAQVRALFGSMGFREISRKDSWECNFVLKDDRGRQLDVHSYAFDRHGNHVHGVAYPLDSLRGKGVIEGCPVCCITPEWLVKFHTGYIPDEDDYHDVKLLCTHLGLKLPLEYERFESSDASTSNRRSDKSDLR